MKNRVEPTLGEATAEAYNPYRPSEANLLEERLLIPTKPKIFDFSGRISFFRYWLIYFPFVLIIPTLLLYILVLGLRHEPAVLIVSLITVFIPAMLLFISLLMRRARDLGWSPAWGLLAALLPGPGTLLVLLLAFIPGQRGPNKYGPPNMPLAWPGKFFVVLLLLIAPLGIAALYVFLPEYNPDAIASMIFPR